MENKEDKKQEVPEKKGNTLPFIIFICATVALIIALKYLFKYLNW